MNAREIFEGRLVMAPMTHGTDLPFRRLLRAYGATVVYGEMAYAHKIVKGERSEMPLLRRHPEEAVFGAQLAGKDPSIMAEAARIAVDHGADFVDVNLGCPIDEATRRGFGASLLRRATRVAALVEAMKKAVDVPVTIKLRLGWSSEKPTYLKIARAAVEAGVDAIALHARSRAQRYRRPADWDHVKALVESVPVPVVGNGDILTWRDAVARREQTGCAGVMVGRWGLTKPWIFHEHDARRDEEPDTAARVEMLKRYVELCREAFFDDERGRRRTRRFLTFHQDFFARYRRGAKDSAVNADDPRHWGDPPEPGLESWLCRNDRDATEALCAWLVDGGPADPPGPVPSDPRRAVKSRALG